MAYAVNRHFLLDEIEGAHGSLSGGNVRAKRNKLGKRDSTGPEPTPKAKSAPPLPTKNITNKIAVHYRDPINNLEQIRMWALMGGLDMYSGQTIKSQRSAYVFVSILQ